MWNLIFGGKSSGPSSSQSLCVGSRTVPLVVVRHPRARRYLLRLLPNGSARVTIPRHGSILEGRRFAEKQTGWLEQQLRRLTNRLVGQQDWQIGSAILFYGETIKIEAVEPGIVRIRSELIQSGTANNLRPAIQKHLHQLAARELPPKVLALAVQHGLNVTRVSVRNQRTRWGSCSRRGTISLNWRLIQVPQFVCDYIILHELMHLRQMNHSPKFWEEVRNACPDYLVAERWLKQHPGLLHSNR